MVVSDHVPVVRVAVHERIAAPRLLSENASSLLTAKIQP